MTRQDKAKQSRIFIRQLRRSLCHQIERGPRRPLVRLRHPTWAGIAARWPPRHAAVDPIDALVSAPTAGAGGVRVVMTVPASGGEGRDIVLA